MNICELLCCEAAPAILILAIVDSRYQGVNGCTDDIRVHSCSPCQGSVRFLDSHIGDSLGTGTALQSMLLIGFQRILQIIGFLQGIAYCVQTSVSQASVTIVSPWKVEVTCVVIPPSFCWKCASLILYGSTTFSKVDLNRPKISSG